MFPRTLPTRLLLATALLAGGAQAQVIYVNAGLSTGADDGTSWANAFQGSDGLRAAIATASPGQQIFAAQGTYYPTQTMDREAAFLLPGGVELYGGFVGNEATPEDRFPFDVFPSVLSGDLLQDDLGGNIADNSRHVVVTSLSSQGALLDRFTITRGNADGNSGLQNRGGGIVSLIEDVTFRDCRVFQNWASFGGASASVNGAGPVFEGCAFQDGNASSFGGGVLLQGAAGTRFDRCSFVNSTAARGGGLASLDSTGTLITNSYFVGNNAEGGMGGGAVYATGDSSLEITNCTITNNGASVSVVGGVAVVDPASDVQVTNTILWDNEGAGGSQGSANQVSANAHVSYSIVEGGSMGIGNLDLDPKFLPGTPFLSLLSPAIDAGDVTAIPSGSLLDLFGETRLVDQPSIPDSGVGGDVPVDIGATEYNQFSGMANTGCFAQPNSTGETGLLTGGGAPNVPSNNLVLAAGDLPLQQTGLFLMSQTPGVTPVSDGTLCLDGNIIRFADDVLNTGDNGGVVFPIDVLNLPQNQVFQIGETWYFQLWHRDVGGSSNFSNSVGFTWF